MSNPSWSLTDSSYTSLPVNRRFEGVPLGADESRIRDLRTDGGQVHRYNPDNPDTTLHGTYEFVFHFDSSQQAAFKALYDATKTVPFYYKPGDGTTLYIWRKLEGFNPRVIAGLSGGTTEEKEWTLNAFDVITAP